MAVIELRPRPQLVATASRRPLDDTAMHDRAQHTATPWSKRRDQEHKQSTMTTRSRSLRATGSSIARRTALLLLSLVATLIVVLITIRVSHSDTTGRAVKLRLLVAANRATPAFCRTVTTLLVQEYKPIVINWGRNEATPYRHKAAKLRGVLDYLTRNTSRDETELVAMVDGFDVWAQQPPHVLLERYALLAQKATPILLAADKSCWPDAELCKGVPDSTIDPLAYGSDTDDQTQRSLTRPRFVNSGMLIGPGSKLASLYAEMVAWSDDPFGDQVVWAHFYRQGQHPIELDYASELFFSLGYAEDDAELMPDLYGIGPSHSRRRWGHVLWNTVTGTLPVFVHFPGKVKHNLFDWWPSTWWGRLSLSDLRDMMADRYVTIADDGSQLSWNELCGDLIDQTQTFVPDMTKLGQQRQAGLVT
ncbi:hypothetical protein ACM66B_003321 [Microbotryomycetes sp. NB124-2]